MRSIIALMGALLLCGAGACSDDTSKPKPDRGRKDLGVDRGPNPDRGAYDAPWRDVGEQDGALPDGPIPDGPIPDGPPAGDLPPPPDLGAPTNELVITEIMANPKAVSNGNGEWFEVYNPNATAVDLQGWKLVDLDPVNPNVHLITSSVVVPAGGYAVLGNNANKTTNGGVTVTYSYGAQWFLANGSDEIALLNGSGKLVDYVTYTNSWAIPSGASLALTDINLDNNVRGSWCVSGQAWSGSAGDKGSPGAATSCTGPSPDGGVKDVGLPPDQGTAVTSLVITEIMANPAAVADDSGEWFELHNPTAQTVNLSGWIIASGTATHTIGTLSIAPGQYQVFARTAGALLPGTPYVYGTGAAADVVLSNSGSDTLALKNAAGTIIDEVAYTTTGTPKWTITSGASLALKSPALDNSNPANWCTETTVISSGTPANADKGSPGKATICQ